MLQKTTAISREEFKDMKSKLFNLCLIFGAKILSKIMAAS